MTPQSLLSQLREKGIQIRISGSDHLVVDAPKGALTPELRGALSTYKSEILRALQAEERSEQHSEVDSRDLAMTATPQSEEPRAMLNTGEQSRGIEDLEVELSSLRAEIEARRAEAKNRRSAAENAMRLEDERRRKIDEEVARQRAHDERLQIESEELERAEEENRRKIAEQELALIEAELKRVRGAEQQRRSEVEARLQAQQEGRRAEIERRRLDDEARARSRFEEERQRIEAEARLRVQEEEALRRTEKQIRAIEEDIARLQARDEARRKATDEAARRAEEEARRHLEEGARRQAQEEAVRRAEEEARLRARIEAEMRAEAEARRKAELEARRRAEDEQRRLAEEEAHRRAKEEALRLAEEGARRVAQEELRRRAEEEEVRRREEEAARLRAEEESRRRVQAEAEARQRAEAEARQRVEEEAQRRADLETRIRAEIEAKIRAEEEAEERLMMPEEYRPKKDLEAGLEKEVSNRPAVEPSNTESASTPAGVESLNTTGIAEEAAIDAGQDRRPEGLTGIVAESSSDQQPINAVALEQTDDRFTEFSYEELNGRFQPVSLPESEAVFEELSSETLPQLHDDDCAAQAAAVPEPSHSNSNRAFRHIVESFDDQDVEVRNAAARALFLFQSDRAAAFTRALREASPERRKNIGEAIASSGLASEAIDNLTGENKETTYDAFSLLFLMSKAGMLQPLTSAIEEHANMEVRLAVVKLLALSGQPGILPAFRRMAVRGSLPPEVRSAVMEAIYQMTSQAPAETTTVN